MNLHIIQQKLVVLDKEQYGPEWLPIDRLHAVAMLAKECVFKAQDELHAVYQAHHHISNRLSVKVEKRLAKIREELEALDRDIRGAKIVRDQCTCIPLPGGRHSPFCPLGDEGDPSCPKPGEEQDQ